MISLLDNNYENYRFATSTKVFEAFKLSKPVITTKNSATGNLVTKVGWGEVIEYNTKALIKSLKRISQGKVTFSLNPEKVEPYSWKNMEKKLLKAYDQLLNDLPNPKN